MRKPHRACEVFGLLICFCLLSFEGTEKISALAVHEIFIAYPRVRDFNVYYKNNRMERSHFQKALL